MENNNAPFYIGQKVVSLKTAHDYGVGVTKGLTYTVRECYHCPTCKNWNVLLEELEVSAIYDVWKCCHHKKSTTQHVGGRTNWFAPIEPLYADITASLAAKGTTEERADQPVKHVVNN